MTLRYTLTRFMKVVIEEAERNVEFEAAVRKVLTIEPSNKPKQNKVDEEIAPDTANQITRGKNRRKSAQLDPVQIISEGETALRAALEKLSLDQLRDIVAEFGMDPGRLVMKWVDPARVIDRIMELSSARARKGDAFRKLAGDVKSPSSLELDFAAEPPARDKSEN